MNSLTAFFSCCLRKCVLYINFCVFTLLSKTVFVLRWTGHSSKLPATIDDKAKDTSIMWHRIRNCSLLHLQLNIFSSFLFLSLSFNINAKIFLFPFKHLLLIDKRRRRKIQNTLFWRIDAENRIIIEMQRKIISKIIEWKYEWRDQHSLRRHTQWINRKQLHGGKQN